MDKQERESLTGTGLSKPGRTTWEHLYNVSILSIGNCGSLVCLSSGLCGLHEQEDVMHSCSGKCVFGEPRQPAAESTLRRLVTAYLEVNQSWDSVRTEVLRTVTAHKENPRYG